MKAATQLDNSTTRSKLLLVLCDQVQVAPQSACRREAESGNRLLSAGTRTTAYRMNWKTLCVVVEYYTWEYLFNVGRRWWESVLIPILISILHVSVVLHDAVMFVATNFEP